LQTAHGGWTYFIGRGVQRCSASGDKPPHSSQVNFIFGSFSSHTSSIEVWQNVFSNASSVGLQRVL
jgi:hypothetical protein